MYCNVPIRNLPVGARLGSSIYDDRQTKLLAAGMEITEQLLETLGQRSVASVTVNQLDLGRILAFMPQGRANCVPGDRRNVRIKQETDVSRELDRQATRAGAPLSIGRPFAEHLRATELRPYDRDLTQFLAERREHHVDQVNRLAEACAKGNASDLEVVGDIMRDSLEGAVEDIDAYICLGANPYSHPYPSRHAMHTAMIASSIGMTLGYDERNLTELGIGCLIHDLGMLGVDRMTVGARRTLDSDEFMEIAKHPLRTFDMIEKQLDGVPVGARMVAYQMHERADGSGYPRGRTLAQMHPLARVAAVADAYTALVSSRPHRPGMLPYHAVEKLLHDTAHGLYDPRVVRGLLNTVSLFPIGSFVQLEGGLVGRVMRRNTDDYMRPVVEIRRPDGRAASTSIVDLRHEPKLKISRPLASFDG